MFKKILVAVAVAAGLLIAAPGVAEATDYTSGSPCQFQSATVEAGGSVQLICVPGTWAPSELVDWSVTGQDGASIQLASFHAQSSTVHFSKHANADGSDVLTITVPADASGAYTVTGVGQTSGHVCTATLTVDPAESAVNSSSTSTTPGIGLSNTGSVVATWVAWLGGGLILLGLIVLAIVYWARRVRSS